MDDSLSFDYVFVGGGVFGLTAALELKKRESNKRVLVIEHGPIPHRHAASTDISKVIRMDYGDDEHYVEMMERCFPIWRQWNQDWNEEIYFESGLLGFSDEIRKDTYEYNSIHTLQKRGHKLDLLDKKQFKKRYPIWGPQYEAYFNPEAGWARSGRVLEHLNRLCISSGVNIQYATVSQLLKKKADTTSAEEVCYGVLLQDGTQILSPIVIVSAGASTPSLLPEVRPIMYPTAQIVFHFEITEPHLFSVEQFPIFFSNLAETGFYGFPIMEESAAAKIAPQNHGLSYPSSSTKNSNTNGSYRLKVGQHGPGWKLKEVTDTSLADLMNRILPSQEKNIRNWLHLNIPTVATAKIVYTRICVYCDMFDGDFLIDHCPSIQGLVVAAGGSGHGFKFAPILGEIIADVVQKKPNKFKSRFAWRPFKPGKKEAGRHLKVADAPTSLSSL